MRLHACRNDYRQHHVTALLARRIAHDPAHGLHNIHLRIARGQEQHRIQCRHVHAFGQAAHVAQHTAGVRRRGSLQPIQLGFFLAGIHAAIDVLGLAAQARAFLDVFRVLIGLNHGLEHAGDFLGADLVGLAALAGFDHLAERHGPPHRLGRIATVFMDAQLGKRLPATDDLGRIVHAQAVVLVLEQGLQLAVDVGFFHRQHDDFVVHQQAALDRFGKADQVELLAVPVLIVH